MPLLCFLVGIGLIYPTHYCHLAAGYKLDVNWNIKFIEKLSTSRIILILKENYDRNVNSKYAYTSEGTVTGGRKPGRQKLRWEDGN